MAFRLRHVAHLPTMPPLSLGSSGLVVLPSLPCGAEEVASASSSGPDTTLVVLLLVAALLWFTMLSSIALQLGGAEPGVESTYWWMDESKMSQVPKPLKKGDHSRARSLD
ncbi:unnamed protein product [Cladocopium goreaui]|uniref:Uncharacterized protein n=1 Tax=Cladocopium goreaui TaxID=2562237 RepID=A0A9P1CWY2_9DINO|nr:unnamed protein product [Cladocopium goreaui]|mmetsp:Transcript_29682/g.64145  ORF Transcript_29682/g.64145 Transcript_29682/m.64145 type:complete len:110 (-) Transcript_29682:25-354(-)